VNPIEIPTIIVAHGAWNKTFVVRMELPYSNSGHEVLMGRKAILIICLVARERGREDHMPGDEGERERGSYAWGPGREGERIICLVARERGRENHMPGGEGERERGSCAW
jgi:hypothetical protein